MKKDIVYKLIIGLLLGINLLQMGTFMFNPKPPQQDKFQDLAIEILNLTAAQQQTFLDFAHEHRNKMVNLYKKESRLVTQYFETPSDTLLSTISKIEMEKIQATEQHFLDIKSMLDTNQVSEFARFKKEALNSILEKNSASGPPRD
ncbi:hypothetical protein [Formosa algae]|uniref:Ribosomal protein L11 n=1 Tax=Formosa algae TaxID=225843 RepID=A0A9X1CCU4_9FLAO|nr:hypothetical protein [Formosa algae]MBP1840650.1 ribosomal protein L11 [Formosa algae]MDQ0335937.1 ribosomal protein L11 [Formosa algae]OEI81168.1 hypothetical protein AST99_05780 [Formosa algae]